MSSLVGKKPVPAPWILQKMDRPGSILSGTKEGSVRSWTAGTAGRRPIFFRNWTRGPGGLTRRQAEERLARYGPNQLEPPRRPGLLSRVMAQMKDPMILVLLGAGGAVPGRPAGGRDWLDAAIILVIVVVNNIISISQEYHAHRALEELRKMTSPHATALRGGAPSGWRRRSWCRGT